MLSKRNSGPPSKAGRGWPSCFVHLLQLLRQYPVTYSAIFVKLPRNLRQHIIMKRSFPDSQILKRITTGSFLSQIRSIIKARPPGRPAASNLTPVLCPSPQVPRRPGAVCELHPSGQYHPAVPLHHLWGVGVPVPLLLAEHAPHVDFRRRGPFRELQPTVP